MQAKVQDLKRQKCYKFLWKIHYLRICLKLVHKSTSAIKSSVIVFVNSKYLQCNASI